MKRTIRYWLHMLIAIPTGQDRRVAVVRRAVAAAGIILLTGEAAVTFQFSGSVGLTMMVMTAGLGAFVYRGIESLAPKSNVSPEAMAAFVDEHTGLPGRQQLIDTLSRDIARCERYSHALTLSVVKVSQYEDLKCAWGGGTARTAIDHVAETLRRITRASDFLCRIDESTFGIILLQCSGRQASLYSDRLSLAVSNRPLKSSSRSKVPLYVGVEVSAVEYDSQRFRGPLDFLSFAGGEIVEPRLARPRTSMSATASDPRALREQLVKDYYPGGEIKDFAEAYREARTRDRHAG
ncbi:MAG: diguanylate cyclase [Dehalococcoidia bacterium]